jgi:acetyltransferase-like isoleucine patch superfamily enzyme
MLVGVRRILGGYTPGQLLVRLAEEYLWWLVRGLPGFEGVCLRYLFLKITTKRLDGFCWISRGCTIVNGFGLSIGRGFTTNSNVLLDALGGIEIGEYCGIGPNTVLIAQEHAMVSPTGFGSREAYRRKPIRIGSNSWIGANCFIKAGVTIGEDVVVGACSNVVSDLPAHARVIGSPARPYAQVMREFARAESARS